MAEDIQTYLREQMPVWKTTRPGVETMNVAVMGCVVNGPGESKHANLGISLPGTFEEPKAPVYMDGKLLTTLKGDRIVQEFLVILEDYVARTYPPANTGELAIVCGATIGAGLGFLWFNAPPAAIFMGDTGSLAMGGLIGTVAVATKHEIVLVIVGGLFVVEILSVIIQVGYFKMTGKRVFLMAPIHHHFEKLGWTESQVVIRFWIIAVILALVGLSTLKLR